MSEWETKYNYEKTMGPHEQLGREIGKLTDEKNKSYGASFSDAHRIMTCLYPNGVDPSQYTDMLAVVRVVDKLYRIATKKDAFGESPWRDVAGYGILGAMQDEIAKQEAWDEQPEAVYDADIVGDE